MNKIIALVVFLSFGVHGDVWSPNLNFSIDEGEFSETMSWVSGYAYATTASYREFGCLNKEDVVESRFLVESMNKKFKGENISADMASEYLSGVLKERYACPGR